MKCIFIFIIIHTSVYDVVAVVQTLFLNRRQIVTPMVARQRLRHSEATKMPPLEGNKCHKPKLTPVQMMLGDAIR